MAARTDHYYAAKPSSASRPRAIRYTLPDGRRLELATDSGVFSASRVDFGSDLLIRALPSLDGRVLDLGCGYGAIGIAISLLNPGAEVWMADVNERAVELCRANCQKHLAGRGGEPWRRAVLSDGFTDIPGRFDAIALNPPIRSGKQRVFGLFAECFGRLEDGGSLYTVIQKKQGLGSAAAELSRLFGGAEGIARKAGYHVLRATRGGGAAAMGRDPAMSGDSGGGDSGGDGGRQ